MINNIMMTGFITTALLLCNPSIAQQSPLNSRYKTMQKPYMDPAFMQTPLPFTHFPTPDELARLAPAEPEPLTEQKIKQQFAQRKAQLSKALDKDRQAAEQYAKDFARYQKHQASNLVQLMAKAEKQRVKILEDLDAQEQRVLQQFQQRQTEAEINSTPTTKQ